MLRARIQEVRDQATAQGSPLWVQAVTFLRDWYFTEEVKAKIKAVIENKDQNWPAAYHLHWGMGVRNDLRKAGFGEAEFGIQNLDNIYVPLVEEAVQE